MNDLKTKYLNLFRLSEKFTEKELKEAYRDLAHIWHPDKHNNNERLKKKAEDQLKEINRGYEYLKQNLKHFQSRSTSYSKSNSEDSTYRSESQYSTSSKKPNPETKKGDKPNKKKSKKRISELIPFNFSAVSAIVFLAFLYFKNNDSAKTSRSPSTDYEPIEISEKLDEKNGYKEFRFGMSVSEAEKIQKPTNNIYNRRFNTTTLSYDNSYSMNIGEYAIDSVVLRFFNDSLYSINLKFSSNQSEIFEAFVHAFGQPRNDDGWTRGDKPLIVKSWDGNFVKCSILSLKNSLESPDWDGIVMKDKSSYLQALEYKESEPSRAGEMIHSNGIKDIKINITLAEFTKLLDSSPRIVDEGFQQKLVYAKAPNAFKIGYYQFDRIVGHFFKDRLYRLDVYFSENRNEFFKSFMSKFPDSKENTSCTRGKQKLTAMQFFEKDNVALILAPESKAPKWDCFVFYSIGLEKEKNKFEQEAPKRAANDI